MSPMTDAGDMSTSDGLGTVGDALDEFNADLREQAIAIIGEDRVPSDELEDLIADYKPPEEDEPPPTFTLSIELGNEACRTTLDVSRLIVSVAEKLDRDVVELCSAGRGSGTVLDFNGNTIGSWVLELP